MDRYICIHGHFYQPPRENPWLEAVEIQDSAYPYHDWNERITAECYSQNSAARILDGERRIIDIASNYARISFNFGPTLLSWMEINCPDIYKAILEADKQSVEFHSGHGNAIAQVYNHIIMPLANSRDKRTQVLWGIKDFERRFRRFPEGMWLSETAVDLETLDILAEYNIKFTILAPHQASRVRKTETGKWENVSGGKIDPTRAYLCSLPSGRRITLFFYDGPISRAVAFENLLNRGEDFADRLLSGFSTLRQWPQILNIDTDGETYGHHHRFGEMALAFALHYIESNNLAKFINYGEYLEKYPPTYEVEIVENTSWSCVHGIERWKNNCGCNSGGYADWHQEWRNPLRSAFDWLRDQMVTAYERKGREFLKSPWDARDGYIDIILDRSKENVEKFFERHAAKGLNPEEKTTVLKLLEIQRHTMLMYTSCGWFFDELSGIETVQVMRYAGRAIQMFKDVFNEDIEAVFLEKLALAKSNIPEHKDGAEIYRKFVLPVMVNLQRVGVHYAVSSLFEDHDSKTRIYCYEVCKKDYQKLEVGNTRLAIGHISVSSEITLKTEYMSFCVLHPGYYDLSVGICTFQGDKTYQLCKDEIIAEFERGSLVDVIRLMDKHFGTHTYSLRDLFRDEQRKILRQIIRTTMEEIEEAYRRMYENNRILMGFLQETGMPIPKALYTAAEFILNLDLKRAFQNRVNEEKIQDIRNDIKRWNIPVESSEFEYDLRKKVNEMMDSVYRNPADFLLLKEIEKTMEMILSFHLGINLWHAQNIYYKLAKVAYKGFFQKAKAGDRNAENWMKVFTHIGEMLFFNTAAILANI